MHKDPNVEKRGEYKENEEKANKQELRNEMCSTMANGSTSVRHVIAPVALCNKPQ